MGHMPWIRTCLLLILVVTRTSAEPTAVIEVPAAPDRGFHSPYFLWLPDVLAGDAREARARLLVIPNNTGAPSDDPAVHESSVRRMLTAHYQPLAEELGAVLLCPVFPRPASHRHIYTHALDADTFATPKPAFRRLDLQLAAMMDDAAQRLRAIGHRVDPRTLMVGFSASGMFVNRFAFLHPERIRAAAIGAPGGWPLAPVVEWQGRTLPYPVGIADIEALAGDPVDFDLLRGVPFFFFLGTDDENDSVPFDDGYDEHGRDLVFTLFGQTPLDRWDDARHLYAAAGLQATFKAYPGAAHEMTPEMIIDVVAFLRNSTKDEYQQER
ncbi:MAG: hypothetical protein EA425_04950 [Puniceicoccaceae bacterium]|nr:MAG: hypothetical protein EA425_04950 [Puniceicoccaceae bacterium]